MKKTPPDQNTLLTPQIIRSKMKEADLYVAQGLFEEGKAVYLSLLDRIKTRQGSSNPQSELDSAMAEIAIRFFHTKLDEIETQRIAFYEKREDTEDQPEHDESVTGESLFNQAMALKGIGLYDEAIQEFSNAAKLGYKIKRCYQEIADSLIQKGETQRGIKLYHTILKTRGIDDSERISILENLASVHETIGEEQRANELHVETILSRLITRGHRIDAEKEVPVHPRRRFRWSIDGVTAHPRIYFLLALLVAVFFMSFVPYIKTVDDVDYLIIEDDPDIKFFENFREVFGNDEFFIIAFSMEKLFTESNLRLLKDITGELEQIEEIEEVTSLANVTETTGGEDYFEVRRFLEDIPNNFEELEDLKIRALRNPLYLKNLVSEDARTTAILIKVFDRSGDKHYRQRLLGNVQTVLDRYKDEVGRYYLAGRTITTISLSRYMKTDVGTFIPITYLLIAVAIWLFFRNFKLTFLGFTNISVCVGSTMGLMGITGVTLNNVTSIIPPMVMALALCDTVHIFSHMDNRLLEKISDKGRALGIVLKKVVLPSFLTTLTTAIGFLSLSVSEIRPVREFAFISSAGMAFEFIFSFFLLPPLILLFKPEKLYIRYQDRNAMNGFLSSINSWIQSRYKWIGIAACLFIVAALYFATKMRVETNLIEFFRPSTDLRRSLNFIENELGGGVESLDISLKAGEEGAFLDPKNLKILDSIQHYARSLEGVEVALSFADYIKDMNQSFHASDRHYYAIPDTREMVAQYMLLYDADDIEEYINGTYDHARIALRLSEHGSRAQKRLIEDMEGYIRGLDHPKLDIRITGTTLQQVNTIDSLVRGQTYSLALAAGVIALIMFVVLRSASLGLVSIIPNILPIILNFGLMGALGIPLDTGTALIAAVALGIAVDDTIHFLTEYRIQRGRGVPVGKSVQRVIFIKGRAIMTSSLVLCIGFGVLLFSSFVPTMNFGLLTAVIMLSALVGDLVVLPSVLLLRRQIPS